MMAGDWFAIRVKSNRERITCQHLLGKGYEVFLPTYRPSRQALKSLDLPLFPGYLFCRFHVHDRLPILIVPGVAHIVGLGRQPVPVSERELDSVRVLVRGGLPLRADEPYTLGQPVRIEKGPLAGAEGVVTGLGEKRLIVS